jgi:NAD(P)-dependent dehydrogenase (short-subunit alcohol dehydrogenase family)
VQEFERVPSALHAPGDVPVRPRGVYLITGGLGDVGFVLGVALAQRARARLVLTGRGGLPPREEWDRYAAPGAAPTATGVRVQKVRALEALGAEVLVCAADAADEEQMRAVVQTARARFGPLAGVIHAAGELSEDTFQPVRQLERAAGARQFAPKVQGLLALREALRGETPDFVLLTSSLSTVLGGVGYAAYAGANAFLDAFAAAERRRTGVPWVSVGFDQWEFPGREGLHRTRRAAREGSTLRPDEGLAVFEMALRLRPLERIVVSTTPLQERLARWVRLDPPAAVAGPAGPAARPRPALATPYAAPSTPTERVLAGIWQELLGLETVGVDDNFFDLGGHSLFAARVLSRLRAALGVTLPLDAIFDAPTVGALAARIDASLGPLPGAPGERVEIEI